MAYPKRLNALKVNGQEKAVIAHKKFVEFVVAEIEKRGIQKVLTPAKDRDNDPLGWLRRAYNRVLNFAEQVQLKQIPNKLEGGGENGEFILKVEISNENNSSQEPRNRIGEFVAV